MTVVDASVVVDWVATGIDERSPAVVALYRLAEERDEITAPRLLMEEVANALLTGLRRRRWNGPQADDAFGRLRRLPLRLIDDRRDLDRAWDLARRYDDHPIYDMLYVALAERTRSVLLTADEALRTRLSSLTWIRGPGQFPD